MAPAIFYLITQTNSGTVQERLQCVNTGCEYQEVEIVGDYLEG